MWVEVEVGYIVNVNNRNVVKKVMFLNVDLMLKL